MSDSDHSPVAGIVIYQTEAGSVDVRLAQDSVWLTQAQMAEVFDTTSENITQHLRNIYTNQELEEFSTTKDYLVVRREGSREVQRQLKHYSLDAIISVGYRVHSRRGIAFRKWATQLLQEQLVRGFTLDRRRLEENARELEAALLLVRKTAQDPKLPAEVGRGLIDVVTRYANTFLMLQRYDDGLLADPEQQPGGNLPSIVQARQLLATLKEDLIARGDATELFARERADAFDSLMSNLSQSVFGAPAYPTIESKAAHLLYFIIKDHPFVDGNKRSGAFLFIDFLHKNDRLFDNDEQPVINDLGLTALALLVAESDAAQKETMIRLIMNMLVPPPIVQVN